MFFFPLPSIYMKSRSSRYSGAADKCALLSSLINSLGVISLISDHNCLIYGDEVANTWGACSQCDDTLVVYIIASSSVLVMMRIFKGGNSRGNSSHSVR